ncbi:hypothetical protein [Apibacter mensalis]|uniref:hypothetical protein n=1 Tax=Apibacter mensalis TaxID=1586267 RepID=UPI00114643A1|nr:hypothetical protein [Apibacter mensalis]
MWACSDPISLDQVIDKCKLLGHTCRKYSGCSYLVMQYKSLLTYCCWMFLKKTFFNNRIKLEAGFFIRKVFRTRIEWKKMGYWIWVYRY